MKGDVVLAQMSDLHLRADPADRVMGVDPTAALAAAIDALQIRPDALLLTGDIADDGSAAAYARVAALTNDVADNVYVIPGNHDDPDALGQVFGTIDKVSLVRLTNSWSLVLVDSSHAGRIGGYVDPAALEHLDALLTDEPNVVVAIHHPIRPPCGYVECSFEGSAGVEAVLAKHHVRLVLSGHLHQPFDVQSTGMRMFGALSTLKELRHVDTAAHWIADDGPVGFALWTLSESGTCAVEAIVR